jgi:hypothetical protein|tara:strand:+ start:823 stop:1089 length:267 start_codon:yes stop_codon:yes gene_type:complete
MNLENENQVVSKDNPMKTWLVDYVGEMMNAQNGEVTVEMIVEAMSKEFPDFLLLVAQENWLRGYEQALYDVDYGDLKKNEQNSSGIHE